MPNVLKLGSRFRTVHSQVGSIPYDSGNVRSLELPRSFLYKTISVRLNGTADVTVAATSLGSDEIPLELIKKIEIIADGRKVIVSGSGRSLYRLAHMQRGKAAERSGPVDAAVQADTPITATILIDFEAARMQRPYDSYFDPRPYEKVELRITWGTKTDLWIGGTTNIDATTKADVQIIHTTQGAQLVGFNRLHLFDEYNITASGTNITNRVPRSGLLAHVLVTALSTLGAPAIPRSTDDTLINFVSLRSDNNFVHFDRLDWAGIQRRNFAEYQLDGPAASVGKIQGHGILDLTEDGLLSSCLNTLDLNNLDLIIDATAGTASIVRVQYVFYEPIL